MVQQCRTVAQLCPQTNDCAQMGGLTRALLAAPFRSRHFDHTPARNSDATGYVGVGLSPGDEYYDEPYFYVSVYPEPDPQVLPTLPMLGHWHGRDFMAAVATAHRIVATKNQQAETDNFLQAAIDGAIKVFR
jgi:hypothetical protein